MGLDDDFHLRAFGVIAETPHHWHSLGLDLGFSDQQFTRIASQPIGRTINPTLVLFYGFIALILADASS